MKANDEKTRCFVSLELPSSFIKEIVRIQKLLQEKDLFAGKYTEEHNIHLTLKFLGEIDYNQVEEVRKRLSSVKSSRLQVSLSEVGVFNPHHIRIIWVGILGADELQKQVDTSLVDLFPKENRFHGHITIARVKSILNKKQFLNVMKSIEVSNFEEEVSEFHLKKSTLTPDGPIYETIEEFNL